MSRVDSQKLKTYKFYYLQQGEPMQSPWRPHFHFPDLKLSNNINLLFFK